MVRITAGQLDSVGWRNNFMVGYQGVVRARWSQRQSPRCGSMTQTGLPSAPARCALDVSMVMTRSSVAMIAAASAKLESLEQASVTVGCAAS